MTLTDAAIGGPSASPATRFVIIAAARTGSTHLVGLLNQRGTMLCNGEVFHKNRVFVRWPKGEWDDEAKARAKKERDADPVGFLHSMYANTLGCRAVGFKIFGGHNKDVLAVVLNDPTIKKIVLYRENVLAIYSSVQIARGAGKFSLKAGMTVPERGKVVFDRDAFMVFHDRYVRHYRNTIGAMNATGQAFHMIEYTQLNEPLLLSGIATFIGVDPAKLKFKPRAQKQNSPDILSRFERPEAVEAFLREHDRLNWRHEGQTSLNDWLDEPPAEPLMQVDGDDDYDEETDED